MEDNKTISQEELEQLKRDAEQGDAEAQYQLGRNIKKLVSWRYEEEAVYWYTKSAEQGHTKALHDLGMIYLCDDEHGDWEKGMSLLTLSAEQGCLSAMNVLGVEYNSCGENTACS